MTKDQICISADKKAVYLSSSGLCHVCYCSNKKLMLDLENTGKSICISCMSVIAGAKK